MQADQAAGLRNRQRAAAPRVVSLIDTPTEMALHLAQALLANAHNVVLIDSHGRHTPMRNTHALFAWQQQLARQGLHTWAVGGVEVLHAPGAIAGDRAIVQACAHAHVLLFDGYTLQDEIALAPTQRATVIVHLQRDKLEHAYALIKTVQRQRLEWRIFLTGDALLAERLIAAAAYFLSDTSAALEYIRMDGDAHFGALAARISAADSGKYPFDNKSGEDYLQHG